MKIKLKKKKKKRIKGNFEKKSPTKFQSKNERFVSNFFGHSQCEGIIININIMMKFDSGSGIEGVEFEGIEINERRQLKKYFSAKIGVAHLSTSQEMFLMFMMRMMEMRNMCMVIGGVCRSYPLQINCAL